MSEQATQPQAQTQTTTVDTSGLKVLTLAEIKAQCRINPNDTTEDALLVRYGKSAETFTFHYIERTLEEVIEEYGEVPDDLVEGMLMLVDHSYSHRSIVSQTNFYTVPYTYDAKVAYYINR